MVSHPSTPISPLTQPPLSAWYLYSLWRLMYCILNFTLPRLTKSMVLWLYFFSFNAHPLVPASSVRLQFHVTHSCSHWCWLGWQKETPREGQWNSTRGWGVVPPYHQSAPGRRSQFQGEGWEANLHFIVIIIIFIRSKVHLYYTIRIICTVILIWLTIF